MFNNIYNNSTLMKTPSFLILFRNLKTWIFACVKREADCRNLVPYLKRSQLKRWVFGTNCRWQNFAFYHLSRLLPRRYYS